MRKGTKQTEESRKKIAKNTRLAMTIKVRKHLSEVNKAVWNRPGYRERMRESQRKSFNKIWSNILSEIPELEKQGFKCIPIGRVIPDMIALKDGKLYAVEVEHGLPNYSKYKRENYRKYFEDIIWILRSKRIFDKRTIRK